MNNSFLLFVLNFMSVRFIFKFICKLPTRFWKSTGIGWFPISVCKTDRSKLKKICSEFNFYCNWYCYFLTNKYVLIHSTTCNITKSFLLLNNNLSLNDLKFTFWDFLFCDCEQLRLLLDPGHLEVCVILLAQLAQVSDQLKKWPERRNDKIAFLHRCQKLNIKIASLHRCQKLNN